jgi:hypothetical protein
MIGKIGKIGMKRKIGPYLLTLGLFLAAIPAAAQDAPGGESTTPATDEAAGDRPVFLVTEILVQDGVGVDASAAANALSLRFGRLRKLMDVRSFEEVKSTLDQEAFKNMLGEDASVGDIGQYVEVDRLVFGRITQVGGVTEVSVRVFNVAENVAEVSLSRRIKKGADPSLVLTVVDKLADNLLAWVLRHYTEAKPNAAFAALKDKKQKKEIKERIVVHKAGSPWGTWGLVGSGLLGAGLSSAVLGGVLLAGEPAEPTLSYAALGTGAGLAVVGTALIVLDGME